MTRPESDFDALRDDLRQVYDGDPWHDGPITALLKGVNAKAAARRTIPKCHTIWELVLHMTVWTREVASRVRGSDAKNPPKDWPKQPAKATDSAWRAAQDELRTAHEDLVRAVDALKPADLVRMVGDQRIPSLSSGKTVGSHIRGLLQHDTYHQGQIALLKKAASS
ncbi:MAG TPA: DinB family protein [Gemmatimonadaceae bacterium]|nr:DinB family protein [Gemmatimonadaceae bacterium]